jgi:2'-hydroxyisoflavone reductase
MQLLLLGGYRFVGRAVIAEAQARGYAVAAFNRGSRTPLPGVEQITGNRDDPSVLRGRQWDVVVDTSGYVPRHVRASAEAVGATVDRYVFVSSLSAYAAFVPGFDESQAVQTLTAGTDPGVYANERYGELKALCEAAAEEVLPGRSIAVRAGFIVGPYDNTDRFNSWVERAARNEPFLVPGAADAPLQMIDVRDLAAWMLSAAEQKLSGPYNVTGPLAPLTALDAARACIAGTGSQAQPAVVPSEVARAAGLEPWTHIPFWNEPEDYGLMQASIARAAATGLRTRPLEDTVRDTYAWLRSSDHPRAIVCPPELERAALHSRGRASQQP